MNKPTTRRRRASFTQRIRQQSLKRKQFSAPAALQQLTEKQIASAELHRTLAEPDIVIYVVAHGRVIQTEKMPHKILWHSIIPVNGCSNYSNEQMDVELMQILLREFRHRTPQNEILSKYCSHINANQDEFFKSSVFFSLKSFNESIETLTPNNWSPVIIQERDTLAMLITEIIYKILNNENIKEYLTNVILSNCRAFFRTLVKQVSNSPPTKQQQNEYMNVYDGMRRINKMEFELNNYFASDKKYSCTKFRRIKLNKHFFFTNLPAESGLFVVYDRRGAAAPSEIFQPSKIIGDDIKKINLDTLVATEGGAISLISVIQMLKKHGYKNIAVFDNSCNSAEEAKAFRKIKLPEMQRSVSAATTEIYPNSIWMSNLSA